MSKRVLFVDDEPSILGIYEMLSPFFGENYTVVTASSGAEGLNRMEEQPFDVVVSDLTMPNMTGIEFLGQVCSRCPATARIVVSGFADEITAAKCLMVAHRYFSKPFNPNVLTNVVTALCDAQTAAANDKIRAYVGKLEAIPTLSRTYLELTKALRSNALSVRDISAIIERDLALTAKVLQMVNSVRFAPARRIARVFDAVQMIGFELVRALVLGIQVFEFCDKIAKTDLFQRVWAHSLETAVGAKRLACVEGLVDEQCEDAFLLGLLHDIGKVVLAASCPEYHSLWKAHSDDSPTLTAREFETLGANHAHVGAYLLRLWGLPDTIADYVEAHQNLETAEITEFNPLIAVHAAQELASARKTPHLNEALISQLGLQDRIADWTNAIRAEETKGKR